MNARFRPLLLSLVWLTLAGPLVAQTPTLRDILPKVPQDANSLVVIDVQGLQRSPLGRKEKWAKQYEADFATGKVPFPPGSALLVLAAHADLDPAGARHSWEIGLLSLTKSVTVERIAEFEQGIVETVSGQKAVLTPRRLYIVPLSSRLVGAQAPAQRQELARWVQFCKKNRTPVFNEWLKDAANDMDKSGQLLMAMHLEDAVDARRVRQRLSQVQPSLPSGTDLDALAQALASVKGLRLTVQVKDDIQAEVRIEFNKSVKAFAPLLQPVLARGVENLGEGFPSLKEWAMEVQDQVVTFRSPLTSQAFSMLLTSIQPQTTPAGVAPTEEAPGGDKVFLARRYLQQVTSLTAELSTAANKTNDYNYAAGLYENYAQRIDRLSVEGVDADLLKYGTGVANKLRTIAESLRGVPITASVLEASKREVFYYVPPSFATHGPAWRRRAYPSIWSGTAYQPEQIYYDSNLPQLQVQLAQTIAKDQQNRLSIWNTIAEDTERIKATLKSKYGMDF
jgi:hypothetical protein